MRQIGIVIPTFERPELTISSFIEVYGDERIAQITIVDDASSIESFKRLKQITDNLSKVKLIRNISNQDCYRNKYTAVFNSDCEWNIVLDSDNAIDKSYINELYSYPVWHEGTIYTPSFAKPQFDFRPYEGRAYWKTNVAEYIDKPMFEVCLNACNYFVNKNEYIKVWDGSVDPVTSDSIYFMSKWFEEGNLLYIVPNLHYEHKVHDGSHYQKNVSRTPQGFHESILNKLKEMK